MSFDVRPMTLADLDDVARVHHAAEEQLERQAGIEPEPWTDAASQRFLAGMRRFVEVDQDGAWVAEDDHGVVGMAEAVRRGSFWGLSMLFVHPRGQSQGVGRQLLGKTLEYADDADVRMIMSSEDPRAIRRYSRTGLSINPAVLVEGTVHRATVPADLPGRTGTAQDLELVAEVDATIGRARQNDAAFLLDSDAVLEIVDDGPRRGFGLHRKGSIAMLGATDNETAAAVFWRMLAGSAEHKIQLWCLTARQDWAVRVALDARLTVKPSGPLFVSGTRPPGPWIPSGWYF